jgi:hypothetical protein
VKRFFVSEDVSSELKNLTEYRWSGTPGGFPGAGFLVLFYAKKVRRDLGGKGDRIGIICIWVLGAKPLWVFGFKVFGALGQSPKSSSPSVR